MSAEMPDTPMSSVEVDGERTSTVEIYGSYLATISIPGPAGQDGKDGVDGKDGQPRFWGEGEPGVIIGAEPGDLYLDITTGTMYRLA